MIIFDLDDTLIDTTGSITPIQLERALHKMVEAGLKLLPKNAVSDAGSFQEALETLRRIDLFSESASQSLKEFLELVDGDPALLSIGEKIVYGDLPEGLVVFPLESAPQVLQSLNETHKLALVSTGKPHQQLLKMESAGLDSTIFSKIVISEEDDKKCSYQRVLDELNAAPATTVVCGDRVRRDLTPAKEIGCRTIQMQWGRGLCSKRSADVDFTIRRLSEIQEIIEGL